MPSHIAIVMDGNRRWAQGLGLPVAAGHASGARRVRSIVQACSEKGVRFLTLFAFSTENWTRPPQEVSSLMSLLSLYLQREIRDMKAKGVRLKFAGDVQQLEPRLHALISDAEAATANNSTITLTLAVNYGGRWDIVQAFKAWQAAHPGQSADALDEKALSPYLALAHAPDPELLIRTGGESRISNFLIWQTAYTELFFSEVLWPSFGPDELDRAITWFAGRHRRFGGCGTPPRHAPAAPPPAVIPLAPPATAFSAALAPAPLSVLGNKT